MSRLYVIAYTPGASGDFICCQLWQNGNHWAKNVELTGKDSATFGPTSVNSYGFKNTVKYLGIEDKPLGVDPESLRQRLYFIDDRYGFRPNTKLKSLSAQELENLWDTLETITENKNLLSSVHIPKQHYPWLNKTKCIVLRPGPNTKDLVNALRVVKSSSHNWKNREKLFLKYEINDPFVIKAYETGLIPKITQDYFKKRGFVTEWELLEIPIHGYKFNQITPMPLPNLQLWLQKKIEMDIDHTLDDGDVIIDLDKLYDHNELELEKLFEAVSIHEIESTTIKEIWNYFDLNLKLFDSWTKNGDGDWKNYITRYISHSIENGEWARPKGFYIWPEKR